MTALECSQWSVELTLGDERKLGSTGVRVALVHGTGLKRNQQSPLAVLQCFCATVLECSATVLQPPV